VIRQGRRGLLSGGSSNAINGDLTVTGNVSATRFLGGAGAVGAPTFSYTLDPDTGAYNDAANSIKFAGGGTAGFHVTGSQLFSLVPHTLNSYLQLYGAMIEQQRTVDIDAAADTISIAQGSATRVIVTLSLGSITSTAAPFLSNGSDGQILVLQRDDDAGDLILQDNATVAGSNMFLPTTSITLGPRCIAVFQYTTAVDTGWVLRSFSDNTP
jgi:hypothetical protein